MEMIYTLDLSQLKKMNMRYEVLFIFVLFGPILGVGICPAPFANKTSFIIEENACGNLWHYRLVAKDSEDDDTHFALFESICPSLNADLNLFATSEDKGKNALEGSLVGYTDVQKAFQWGTRIDIYDCEDNLFVIVEEANDDVLSNGVKVTTSFQILDPEENVIGFSEKKEWLDTEFTIRDMDGISIATAIKSVGDKWGAAVCIDPTWNITMLVSQTDLLSDPHLIAFITSIKGVGDMSDGSSDSCTTWRIVGIVSLCIGGVALIACLAYGGCLLAKTKM